MAKKETLPEYKYVNNKLTFSQNLIGFVRKILETVLPILKLPPIAKLVDKVFASEFAKSFLGSYAMLLMM